MRRPRSYANKLVAILGLYLFIVAFVTYKNIWSTAPIIAEDSFEPVLTNEQGKNDKPKVVEENFIRVIGDEEILPLEIPNGTSVGFEGDPKIIFVTSSEFSQQHLGGCPDWNCRLVTNNEGDVMNKSDAIVFYGGAYAPPKIRDPSQYYVFFTQESPLHSSASAPYADFYNLTLGYRRDADAPCPYGYSVRRRYPLAPDEDAQRHFHDVILKKKKLAAWFVSNCGAPSGRSNLVKELQKYMQVDVYGSCGTMSCPKGKDCNDMLERDYKFYFAFENSICKDYMTEKFWERMTMNMVVVVLKRSVVEKYVPPDSFIAADDFSSAKEMAEYLLKIDGDNELYLKYLKWKLNYEAIYLNGLSHDIRERPWGFCRLCKLLWRKPFMQKTYPNAQHWWNEEANCDSNLVNKLINGN